MAGKSRASSRKCLLDLMQQAYPSVQTCSSWQELGDFSILVKLTEAPIAGACNVTALLGREMPCLWAPTHGTSMRKHPQPAEILVTPCSSGRSARQAKKTRLRQGPKVSKLSTMGASFKAYDRSLEQVCPQCWGSHACRDGGSTGRITQ